MYQNAYYNRKKNTVYVWDDTTGLLKIPYRKYAYVKSPTGTLRTIDGHKVEKIYQWSDTDANNLYESDLNPVTRTLIDMYHESDDMSDNHRELIIDIEVDATKKFPDIKKADNEITAIAIYYKQKNAYICFILDKDNIVSDTKVDDVMIRAYRTEKELLEGFIKIYGSINPTIISGWNIDMFDIPYLYTRMKGMCGETTAKKLSPVDIVEYNKNTGIYELAGVSCMDYLPLYKKYTPNEKESYRLDFIGKEEVGLGKIEFEGSLDTLFKTDINKFIDYNLNDVIIVKKIDEKLKYIELTRSICHKGHVTYNAIYASSRYLDGAILTYMKRLGIIAPNAPKYDDMYTEYDSTEIDEDDDGEGLFEGAYVKPPKPGRYKNLISIDAQSLYPSVIRTLNISYETKMGKVQDWNHDDKFVNDFRKLVPDTVHFKTRTGTLKKYTKDEFIDYVESNDYGIASNGSIYNKTKGLIPAILDTWFNERLQYKELVQKYVNEGNVELEEYYDRLQYVTKILLNSMYGVLGLPVFRFYDLDNAEAVTTTGKDYLKFADKSCNMFIKKCLSGKENIDYCIYSDTDSLFLNLDTYITDNKLILTNIIKTSNKIAEFLNDAVYEYGKRYLNVSESCIVFKEESLIESGFWLAKKRYAYKKVYDMSKGQESDKLVVKGLDVVRSNFPKIFRDTMKHILLSILNFDDKSIIDDEICGLLNRLDTLSIDEIAKPTGVKRFRDKKGNPYTRVKGPAHVKAALNYNFLLEQFKLTDMYTPIYEGGKLKWVYLSDNPYHIDGLAFKGYDDPKEITGVISKYIDREKCYGSNLVKKLTNFYYALNWGLLPNLNTKKAEEFFSF